MTEMLVSVTDCFLDTMNILLNAVQDNLGMSFPRDYTLNILLRAYRIKN